MSPKRLVIFWIIPNILFYLAFIGALIFVFTQSKEIREAGQMGIWALMIVTLLIIAVLGSARIKYWLKQ
ncbi:hypothetical protein KP77_09530 [Jeotgalibacillus alimentarius]|uniref:Uncharacterized protein n=1 Tax=Jeotgalibacillus alimentarius TaxID=135826 RepID=A0A0C2W4B1_9BACL|nr:hypothetical protein [Jeotgalibacillus alimentarius]KIL51441.1 hypothetical protein KP77_09530 [Jeotgalibacillus alimentarius]